MNGSRGGNFLRTYGAGGTDPIFRQVSSLEVCSLGNGLAMAGWSDAQNVDLQFFSAVRQLLSAAHGRERLSHRSSSNWALLCTRCLPRWR